MSVLLEGLNYMEQLSLYPRRCEKCIYSWRTSSPFFRDMERLADNITIPVPEFNCMVPWLVLSDYLQAGRNAIQVGVNERGICDAFSARPDRVNDTPSWNEMKIFLLSKVKLTVVLQ